MYSDQVDQTVKLQEAERAKPRSMKIESKFCLTITPVKLRSIRKSCKLLSISLDIPMMRFYWSYNSRLERHLSFLTFISDSSMKKMKEKNKILFQRFKMQLARHLSATVVTLPQINTLKDQAKMDTRTWESKLHMFLLPNLSTVEAPQATLI